MKHIDKIIGGYNKLGDSAYKVIYYTKTASYQLFSETRSINRYPFKELDNPKFRAKPCSKEYFEQHLRKRQ